MDPQPYTIDDQADANDYLTDLLQHLGNRSTDVIERHCALRVKDPAIKEYFLATGAKMLAGLKNTP
ncbi:hypothetical protein FV241_12690 [Methylobacterium sp. WL2]|nr:hypothetical protein FVA80_23995 [Methylobacterium sp. WL1]TXN57120.1 hypothetical protein FV241_12690 [Methylobacterium sp. WL2]